jgi:uncharacterized protein (TIGR03067 family)
MRFWSFAVLACVFALAIGRCVRGGDDKDDDVKGIQGTWLVDPATFAEVKDKEALKEALKGSQDVRIIFEGDKYTMKHPPGNEEKGAFRLDPSKKPKEIDFGDRANGIYELEGDTLKLCWDQQGKTNGRPTKFSLKQDKDSVHYFVLKREKKK